MREFLQEIYFWWILNTTGYSSQYKSCDIDPTLESWNWNEWWWFTITFIVITQSWDCYKSKKNSIVELYYWKQEAYIFWWLLIMKNWNTNVMEEQNIEFFTIYLLQLSIEKFLNNVKVIYEFIKEKISPKMYHISLVITNYRKHFWYIQIDELQH